MTMVISSGSSLGHRALILPVRSPVKVQAPEPRVCPVGSGVEATAGTGAFEVSCLDGWMDRTAETGVLEGSLHVGVAPVPQRLVCLLDDLG